MPHARLVETGRQDGSKRVMFAHIIATLGKSPVVTDGDMQFPPNWRDALACRNSSLGHQITGRTICLHSFSVCPEVQGIGIGKTAMKSYLQMMNESGVADRIALICKEVSISPLLSKACSSSIFSVACWLLYSRRFPESWRESNKDSWSRVAQHGEFQQTFPHGQVNLNVPSFPGVRAPRPQGSFSFGPGSKLQ